MVTHRLRSILGGALLALLIPAQAFATEYAAASSCKVGQCDPNLTTGDLLLSAVALNGSQSARTTPAINVEGFTHVRLTWAYTRSAGTDLKIYCEESDNNSTWRTYFPIDSNGVVLGSTAAASNPIYQWTALTASSSFSTVFGVIGLRWFRCYATVASAGANDKITVTYSLFY